MDEQAQPQNRGGSRSNVIAERRARARKRRREQREAARDQERRIAGAVDRYISAWGAESAVAAGLTATIADLEAQISQAQDTAREESQAHRYVQARAAADLRGEVHSVDEVAELLELTPAKVRELIALNRQATSPEPAPPARERVTESASDTVDTDPADPMDTPSESLVEQDIEPGSPGQEVADRSFEPVRQGAFAEGWLDNQSPRGDSLS